MTREIPLTQNQVALVDDCRFVEFMQWKWQAKWNENTQSFYATRYNHQDRTTIYMHREIMKTPKGMICDHRDHDTLNNQEHNLRNVTYSQNNMNRRSHNTLGEKNITRHKKGFRVAITAYGERLFYKTFPTLELAKSARDQAVQEIQGEFAYGGEE